MYFAYGDRDNPTNSLQVFELAVAEALLKLKRQVYGENARVKLVDCYAQPAINPPTLPNILRS